MKIVIKKSPLPILFNISPVREGFPGCALYPKHLQF